jgi:hypothetical protein
VLNRAAVAIALRRPAGEGKWSSDVAGDSGAGGDLSLRAARLGIVVRLPVTEPAAIYGTVRAALVAKQMSRPHSWSCVLAFVVNQQSRARRTGQRS